MEAEPSRTAMIAALGRDAFALRKRRRGYWTTHSPWYSSARGGRSYVKGSNRCFLAKSSARPARLSALAAGTPRTGWLLAPSPSTSSWGRGLTRSRGGARTCSTPSRCLRLITLLPRLGSSSEPGISRCRSATRRCSSRLISRPSLFTMPCTRPGSSGASRRCSPGTALPPI